MRALILLALGTAACLEAADAPVPDKVAVVAMFERGADTGDQPGEFQDWVEREKLDRVLPFPQGYHALRMKRDGVLGTVTGVGTARAAASVGSAAWAEWVVDGDLGCEIDAREMPPDWKTGFVPLPRTVPYEQPRKAADAGEVYHLNPALVDWAFRLTREVAFPDSMALQNERRLTHPRTVRHLTRVLRKS